MNCVPVANPFICMLPWASTESSFTAQEENDRSTDTSFSVRS